MIHQGASDRVCDWLQHGKGTIFEGFWHNSEVLEENPFLQSMCSSDLTLIMRWRNHRILESRIRGCQSNQLSLFVVQYLQFS